MKLFLITCLLIILGLSTSPAFGQDAPTEKEKAAARWAGIQPGQIVLLESDQERKTFKITFFKNKPVVEVQGLVHAGLMPGFPFKVVEVNPDYLMLEARGERRKIGGRTPSEPAEYYAEEVLVPFHAMASITRLKPNK